MPAHFAGAPITGSSSSASRTTAHRSSCGSAWRTTGAGRPSWRAGSRAGTARRSALDVQPHGGLRGRGRRRAAVPGGGRRDRRLPASRRGGGAAPVPRRGGAGLLVPGEGEILGQVRAAFEAGVDRRRCSTASSAKRCTSARRCGRRRRSRESPASVSAAAAALAQQVFGDLSGRRILVVGAGKIGEQAARSLLARGAEISVVANRTLDRAAGARGPAGRGGGSASSGSRTSSRARTWSSRRRARPGYLLSAAGRACAPRAEAGRSS